MKLRQISLHNYKSLRSVTIAPGPFAVLVGANASGKSNFCDALDFIGEMYRWGLELAVTRHGGYENICYRHTRRSKAPITIELEAELPELDTLGEFFPISKAVRKRVTLGTLTFRHSIEFGTSTQRIQAPFSIRREVITVSLSTTEDRGSLELVRCERSGDRITELTVARLEDRAKLLSPTLPSFFFSGKGGLNIGRLSAGLRMTQSITTLLERWVYLLTPFSRRLSSINVFQLSPDSCRLDGVPTPHPDLDRTGGNLPAVIEFIKAHRQRQYQSLLDTLKRVMPTLEDLDVAVTDQKTLGLRFHESGFGRPWTAVDISDGTIRAVALLAAVFDPNIDVIVIEESENSLHPWAIRQFVEACRVASETKQIILTTHSQSLINRLSPSEIWIAQRPDAATRIDALTVLDPTIESAWRDGEYMLSEYLDSGAVSAAVPVPPL